MAGQEPNENDAAPGVPSSGMVVLGAPSEQDVASELDAICAVVHQHTGHDFSRYKRPTFLRRIRRRVLQRRCANPIAAKNWSVLSSLPSRCEPVPRLLVRCPPRCSGGYRSATCPA